MPAFFPCPYLNAEVELTDEREANIIQNHPDLLPDHLDLIRTALSDPDTVHRSRRDTLIFSRWYDHLYGGKHFLVFVVDSDGPTRYWIVTARLSRIPIPGEALWQRS